MGKLRGRAKVGSDCSGGSSSPRAVESFQVPTHRPLSSSFLGLPYRILNTSHKKELLRGLWVYYIGR